MPLSVLFSACVSLSHWCYPVVFNWRTNRSWLWLRRNPISKNCTSPVVYASRQRSSVTCKTTRFDACTSIIRFPMLCPMHWWHITWTQECSNSFLRAVMIWNRVQCLSRNFVQRSLVTLISLDNAVLDMLSPTRSSSQALLKNVVTTVAGALRDSASASTSIEHEEESNDADDQEPSKKKFKDDAESEVRTLSSGLSQHENILVHSSWKHRSPLSHVENDHRRNAKSAFPSAIAVGRPESHIDPIIDLLLRRWLFRIATVASEVDSQYRFWRFCLLVMQKIKYIERSKMN